MCKMKCVDGSASWTSWMDQLDGPAGTTSWTDQLDRPAGRISWTDQLDWPIGRTSSLYLKTWPVCIFEDWPFSLYVVAASESDRGIVFSWRDGCILFVKEFWFYVFNWRGVKVGKKGPNIDGTRMETFYSCLMLLELNTPVVLCCRLNPFLEFQIIFSCDDSRDYKRV